MGRRASDGARTSGRGGNHLRFELEEAIERRKEKVSSIVSIIRRENEGDSRELVSDTAPRSAEDMARQSSRIEE